MSKVPSVHTHKKSACIGWWSCPLKIKLYTSVLQYKSSYYLNDKEALSGLPAVPFAND